MIIGNKVYRKSLCDNTLAWAKSQIHDAPDGALFLTDNLTHARGRQGRTWEILPEQLWVTILLKPKTTISKDQLNSLNMALSLGILSPLKQYNVSLKWPNDFCIQSKKVGGMLMEVVWQDDNPKAMILGFALNVNTTFTQDMTLYQTATSLHSQTLKPINKNELLGNLVLALNRWYIAWLEEHNEDIFKAWKAEQSLLNKVVTLHHDDGSSITGTLQDVTHNGDALVATPSGQKTIGLHTITLVS